MAKIPFSPRGENQWRKRGEQQNCGESNFCGESDNILANNPNPNPNPKPFGVTLDNIICHCMVYISQATITAMGLEECAKVLYYMIRPRKEEGKKGEEGYCRRSRFRSASSFSNCSTLCLNKLLNSSDSLSLSVNQCKKKKKEQGEENGEYKLILDLTTPLK